ncbi:Cyanovirin-N [Thozetella sp. PMI_491]|nr:Cyanovirin-N [Thozetella sp. PMI_491]
MSLFLIGFTAALLASRSVLASGAGASCSLSWYGPSGVSGNCGDGGGGYRTSIEDMNLCLTNNDGALAWQDNGGFAGSCYDCSVVKADDGHYYLLCLCRKKSGEPWDASINLDDGLTNLSGYLWCYNHRGT